MSTRHCSHGAFFGLLSSTIAAAVHHGISLPAGSVPGLKGGWISISTHYPSEMAQNFWTAIWAFTVCFVLTTLISLVTRPKPASELQGLVYAHTEMPKDPIGLPWYQKPAALGAVILIAVSLLNLIFW